MGVVSDPLPRNSTSDQNLRHIRTASHVQKTEEVLTIRTDVAAGAETGKETDFNLQPNINFFLYFQESTISAFFWSSQLIINY